MLIEEIVRTELDEGIKDWIAQAALATSLMFAPDAAAQPKPPSVSAKSAVMSKPMLTQLTAMRADTPAAREQLLKTMAISAGIKGNELAALLAQASHETRNFNNLREVGSPAYFDKYDKRSKAKILGNIQPGDGYKYRGGGFLQITGRYNYAKIGKALGIDLEKNPALIERPGIAAAASLIFWQDRVKPKIKDFKNVEQVTKKINPAQRHLARRKAEFKKMQKNIRKTK
jgi:putative chitinase